MVVIITIVWKDFVRIGRSVHQSSVWFAVWSLNFYIIIQSLGEGSIVALHQVRHDCREDH
jgi:hypothetical protein